ncbi:sulfonate ABC transporter substrate-binding protein [Variovorax sp. J22P168]|uniref:sulfonate ABC transporter substrate-binding protein n=1 Tax=Variovorax jilinensis TaxID=3053513 RepID=UPI0025766442|nr:sulfonate ABC transporter substrate-binding protein [Variovorax sp. J22P168]MDM0014690.1 sulfonate ABC transporter substrate-binding protein [Variovorax sp. J22P168]
MSADHAFRLRRRHIAPALFALSAVAAGFALPAAAQTALPKEVRIGFQKGSAVLVLARKQQVIENRLKALGVPSVKWVEFQFGPPMLEALGAGAIDLGSVGDTPPVFAQAGGSDLVYAAATPSAQHAVLVPKDSPIKSLADLKGKKVAFGKGSSAHNVTIKALATAGLKFEDIVPTYLSPADATAAFNGGNIDAWVVWDPYAAIAEERYGARVLANTSDKRLASASYYMASRDFATRYPVALGAVLDELGKLTTWSGQHRDELSALAAEATGIDVKSWSTAFGRAEFTLGPVTDAHVAQQQQLADTFVSLGIIPRKINVREIVWRAPVAP